MVESMTGYGRSALKLKKRSLVVEVKSVNSKFLEIKNHLPKEFSDFDSKVTALIKKSFARGVIDMFLSEPARGSEKSNGMIDYEKARAFYSEARKLQKSLKLAGTLDINTILRYREIAFQPNGEKEKINFTILEKGLTAALGKLKAMRRKEGAHLEKDIRSRLAKIADLTAKIDENKDLHIEKMVEKLSKKVEDIGADIKFDSGRIEQEIVLYAAKADICEEITRMRSRLKRMDEFLKAQGPCGRNLDFVLQEMNREINTIGSKTQSGEISGYVVGIKGELEKIREQVQNVE
jgi:uncharacterized protein (TIGR00255 family)